MLQQKKLSIRNHIRDEYRNDYFNRIRQAKLKELDLCLDLEGITEEVIMIQLTHQASSTVNFDRIYHFMNQHDEITQGFVVGVSQKILDDYRTNQGALCSLCLLLQKYPNLHVILEQNGLNLLIVDNLQIMQNLHPALIVLYRVLAQSDNKESYEWLPPLYDRIFHQIGYGSLVILLLYQATKCPSLLPNYEQMSSIANTKIGEGEEANYNYIANMLMRCFDFHKSLDYFGLAVIWVASQLKSTNLTPSLQSLSLQCLAYLFRQDAAKQFIKLIVEGDHEIIHLILLSCVNSIYHTRTNAIQCLCKIINNCPDDQISNLSQKYSIIEPLGRAFQLQLSNSLKFQLLCSIGFLFQLIPESIRQLSTYGALRGIFQCEYSPYKQLHQMSSYLIDQFQLHH